MRHATQYSERSQSNETQRSARRARTNFVKRKSALIIATLPDDELCLNILKVALL